MEHRNEPYARVTARVRTAVLGALVFVTSMLASTLMAGPNASLDMNLGPWLAINDGVMGGISRGEMIETDDGLRFQGSLSLENNGGFASVRRPFDGELEGASGIRLHVRGDGRSYQFRIRLDNNFDGITWRNTFDTDGSRQTVDLDLEDFEPVFRGRLIADAGKLDTSRIRQLGFLLADGKAGAFQLDISAIEFLYP